MTDFFSIFSKKMRFAVLSLISHLKHSSHCQVNIIPVIVSLPDFPSEKWDRWLILHLSNAKLISHLWHRSLLS